MGPALLTGKDRSVDLARQLLVGGQDAGAAGAVEALVRCEADDVGVADRARHDTRGDHARDVGDVGQEVGAHGVCDLAKARPVGHPGVGGVAGDDHLGFRLAGERLDGLIVQPLGGPVDAVGDNVVGHARAVDRAAMGQVPAVQQVHAHDGAAQGNQRV
jgi:hypothetical protein